MSQQFCYALDGSPGTPNVELEAFHLLTLYDLRADTDYWATVEAEIVQSIAALQSRTDALQARLMELRKFVFKVHRAI
jgi:hypothetical protein